MPIEKHDLAHEFPEYRDQIQKLNNSDIHFCSLCKRYEELDEEVWRIEVGIEASSDDYLENQKKHRVYLKDELYALLRAQTH